MIRRQGSSPSEQARAALALLDLPDPDERRPEEDLELPPTNPGPQTVASDTVADIIIYGGHAGGGKTFWLLREALRHHRNALHRAVLFRRTHKQATKPGSLWDNSLEMYRAYGARPRGGDQLDHTFPSGASITIGHVEHEKNRFDWDGSQASMFGFDQLEAFTEIIFWYIALSRGRSLSGIKPYIRATANPVPPTHTTGGWLSKLLMTGGWVDAKTGAPVESASGTVRWFYRHREGLHFYDSPKEARLAFPEKAGRGVEPLSMTFVEARLEDNPVLEAQNPAYRSGLEALPWVERQRLLGGNWKVSGEGGGIVKRDWLRRLPHDPAIISAGQPLDHDHYTATVFAWDLAGSDRKTSKRTAGVLMSREADSGRVVIRKVCAVQMTPGRAREFVAETSLLYGGPHCTIVIPQDPGQAGKAQAGDLVAYIAQKAAELRRPVPTVIVELQTGSKLTRGLPFAAAAEPALQRSGGEVALHGQVDVVEGDEVDDYLEELHHFDGTDNAAADFWDATASAFNRLNEETSADDGQLVY